jgi:hypothetical protein
MSTKNFKIEYTSESGTDTQAVPKCPPNSPTKASIMNKDTEGIVVADSNHSNGSIIESADAPEITIDDCYMDFSEDEVFLLEDKQISKKNIESEQPAEITSPVKSERTSSVETVSNGNTAKKYLPPKQFGIKSNNSQISYNWTPGARQANNWREGKTASQSRKITRNLNYDNDKPWQVQENRKAKRFPRQNNGAKKFGNMSQFNKNYFEQALKEGRWTQIKKSLQQLHNERECMTLSLSRKLSGWLEHGVYRCFLEKEHTKQKFSIYIWPVSERKGRGCATLADPTALIGYLNYPALHHSLNGIAAEQIWQRLDRTERLRLVREATISGFQLNKKHN